MRKCRIVETPRSHRRRDCPALRRLERCDMRALTESKCTANPSEGRRAASAHIRSQMQRVGGLCELQDFLQAMRNSRQQSPWRRHGSSHFPKSFEMKLDSTERTTSAQYFDQSFFTTAACNLPASSENAKVLTKCLTIPHSSMACQRALGPPVLILANPRDL